MSAVPHSDGYHTSTPTASLSMFRLRSLGSVQPRHFASSLFNPETKLALRAMAQVIRAGHHGDLPLFAATLGLSASEFQAILHDDVQFLAPELPSELLSGWLPEQFMPMVSMLCSFRVTDEPLVRWLSHAIAAACYGRRHLWQDLGLSGRADVSQLLGQWFPRLFDLNIHDLKWKRFLFEQLGERQGKSGLKPPSCNDCDSYRVCFSGN